MDNKIKITKEKIRKKINQQADYVEFSEKINVEFKNNKLLEFEFSLFLGMYNNKITNIKSYSIYFVSKEESGIIEKEDIENTYILVCFQDGIGWYKKRDLKNNETCALNIAKENSKIHQILIQKKNKQKTIIDLLEREIKND